MAIEQLLLFEEPIEEKLQRRMIEMEQKYERLRKGQYAKITKLQADVRDLIAQMEFLNSQIARKGYFCDQ